ncbi:hypothetical protein PCC79_07470 [Propioniciclava soli]|uniref:Uncharacterized protein n=1 Tax=Propioniciclava soli TaxID=2775081 RepID=A0ABZ3CB48_9ACTN
MARKARPVFDADRLVDEFKVYDRHVDVVSSFHWLYTQVTELADTVAQFERYPSIKVGDKSLTPDFTVAFTDGSGMAGEVANLSLRDESVEGLCRQLQGYAELTEMPGPPNQKGHQAPLPVSPVDVLFLTPVAVAADAADRVLTQRVDDPEHWFSPPRRPVLVHYSQEPDKYVFLVWPAGNGTLHRGQREHVFGDRHTFRCLPDQFGPNKVQYGFMNDQVPGLYMATRLWTQVLPNSFWQDEATVPLAELVAAVKDQHEGHGNTREVRLGMQVLVAAGLAKETVPDKEWVVTRRSLRRSDKDVAVAIAERVRKAAAPSATPPARRPRKATPGDGQETLF